MNTLKAINKLQGRINTLERQLKLNTSYKVAAKIAYEITMLEGKIEKLQESERKTRTSPRHINYTFKMGVVQCQDEVWRQIWSVTYNPSKHFRVLVVKNTYGYDVMIQRIEFDRYQDYMKLNNPNAALELIKEWHETNTHHYRKPYTNYELLDAVRLHESQQRMAMYHR